jgi:hypothetical protein
MITTRDVLVITRRMVLVQYGLVLPLARIKERRRKRNLKATNMG